MKQARPAPADERRIKTTTSLCPECLIAVDATVSERSGEVWMDKTCPQHGRFESLLSSDARRYLQPPAPAGGFGGCCGNSCATPANSSSPAMGTAWSNRSCTILIEVTERCNMSCPTCYAGSSPHHTRMMSMQTFRRRLDGLEGGGKKGADAIQLSGGEPTLHPELVDFVGLLFARGFRRVMINTNGIRLAQPGYADRLLECVRSHPACELHVYLQFDGFARETHAKLRGRGDLLALKQRAIRNCADRGIGVHPVMTLTRGINDHEVGDFVAMAVANPAIRHIVIQPAMYSGRYDNPRRADRLTLADAIALVAEQSGTYSPEDFGPIPCSDPNCYATAVAIRDGDALIPISRYFPKYEEWASDDAKQLVNSLNDSLDGPRALSAAVRWIAGESNFASAAVSLDDSELDRLLDSLLRVQALGSQAHEQLLAISIKPFMDAWTYDKDRIDKCCVHILDDDGNPVSFCHFNAVNRPQAIMSRARAPHEHGG